MSEIEYKNMETQPYLMSTIFGDDETQIHSYLALRSRMRDGFMSNFCQMNGGQIDCPQQTLLFDAGGGRGSPLP